MIGRVNTGGGGTKSTIIVSIATGSTVGLYDSTYSTLIKSGTEKTAGKYWFTGLDNGTYYIKATKGVDTTTLAYTISEYGVYRITMTYSTIPEFTYTGSYQIVNDSDTPITTSSDNWKIRFLTSGTLNFSRLNGAENGIDVFLVGGGGGGGGARGGGGGGGYTKTTHNVSVQTNTDYTITVGAGGKAGTSNAQSTSGSAGGTGGTTSAFSQSASGGVGGKAIVEAGGNGGSGGGSGGNASTSHAAAGAGGSNGGNGGASNKSGGTGQGTTTGEFGNSSATRYAGGGGGGSDNSTTLAAGGSVGGGKGANNKTSAVAGSANTGGGGGGGHNDTYKAAAGGSGIVVIRNKR